MEQRKLMPSLVPVDLSGIYRGTVMTTPVQVGVARPPSFFIPQAKVKVNLDINAYCIQSAQWMNQQGAITLSVSEGGVQFPSICPGCMKTAVKTELVEVAVSKRGLGKVEFTSKTVPADRIYTALTSDRYWIHIPFCETCCLKNHAIGFTDNKRQKNSNYSTVLLKKLEYAREFAVLNHVDDGRWLAPRHILMRALGLASTFVFSGFFLGGLAAESSGNAVITIPVPVYVLFAFFALAGIVASIIGNRGEAM